MIESVLISHKNYIGSKNIADIFYEETDFSLIKELFVKVCFEMMKVTKLKHKLLLDDELILGLDTGPYNFVYGNDNQVYYVDFYPPRIRINIENKKLDERSVITDYPKPRDEQHRKHLLKYFYTKSGLWKHLLGHLFACLDSNHNLNCKFGDKKRLQDKYEKELWNTLLKNNIEFFPNDDFEYMRNRYFNHRVKYYSKSKDSKAKGYNISGHSIVQKNGIKLIRKFYIDYDKPFTENSGIKMLNESRLYYKQLKETGIKLPKTSFHLLQRQTIIIAAGLGTRLKKLTQDVPKMLVNINNEPLINYIIKPLINCGVTSFTTIVPPKFTDNIKTFYIENYPNYHNDILSADLKGVGYSIFVCYDKFKNNKTPLLITPCDVFCPNGYNELFDKLNDFHITLGVTPAPIIAEKAYTYAKTTNGKLIISDKNKNNFKPLNGVYAIKSPKVFFSLLHQKIYEIESNKVSIEAAIRDGIMNKKGEYRLSWIFNELSQTGLKIGLVNMEKCYEINSADDIKIAEKELMKFA